MPDSAKFAALRAAKVRVLPTCGSCVWWDRQQKSAASLPAWGWCKRVSYEHGKHTGRRMAGTPLDGSCPQHEWTQRALRRLESYAKLRGAPPA